MSTLNKITVTNSSNLDPKNYTVWVAGFIQQMKTVTLPKTKKQEQVPTYMALQSDGSFLLSSSETAAFMKIDNGMVVHVPDVTNYGNNRLVFTVTAVGSKAPTALSPITGYTAYPFPGIPGVAPSGPYDIFEFGPNAQYDTSAVDSLGINLSFTVKNDALTYGTVTAFTRAEIGASFQSFMASDPLGSNGFAQLLYTNPTTDDYPDVIKGQFSAIVAPKDWLAIYPSATGLKGFWTDTVDACFTKGNQLNFYLNAANVGTYSGTSDGTKFTLTGPASAKVADQITYSIPKSDFAKNQGFIQAVRAKSANETAEEYGTFGQIEAALFEALSRGVLLDGVVPKGKTIADNYSSDAWIKISNWYTTHKNAYNSVDSKYDAYAKFMHHGTVTPKNGKPETIFGLNKGKTFGMAYGFSLDESPNVSQNWNADNNVPSKPEYNIGSGQDVALVIGPWIPAVKLI
ncbi:beta-1,3-glucanase family protein [Lacinutrix jangbogonensis]|uniref:beta-1,3-glucanase family protein n=1 Tax=Lacinutrix jangbogonensis TaxID=1469557 RepID=UPI00053E94B0|nr:beta-1,3-glucanase family protein [Lacinutrix jangbogonensis]